MSKINNSSSQSNRLKKTPSSVFANPVIKQHEPSVTEKFTHGYSIDKEPVAVALSTEKGAEKLSEIYNAQGGIDYDLNRYKRSLTKDNLQDLKKSVDFDNLGKKTDDISKLSYKQLESLFDYLEKIIDEDALEKHTGVSSDVSAEKDFFVTKRLYPDPVEEAEKGKGITLWTKDEDKFLADLKQRKHFKYVQKSLIDAEEHDNFLNPYKGLSQAAKNLLQARRKQLDYYFSTLPYEKRIKEEDNFLNSKLMDFNKIPNQAQSSESITYGTLPEHYKPIDHSFLNKNFIPNNKRDDFKLSAQRLLDQNDYGKVFYEFCDQKFL